MTVLEKVLCVLAFLAGCAIVQLCPAAGTPEEHARLEAVNKTLGTGYVWSDAAYAIALEEATYWASRGGLGHRRGYYAYGHRGNPDNCANGWLGSSAHRNGIQRDFRNGDTGGAVATVGNVSYFAPVKIVAEVTKPRLLEKPKVIAESPAAVCFEEGCWANGDSVYCKSFRPLKRTGNFLRRLFR